MNKQENYIKIEKKLKEFITEITGADPEDIENEDILSDELHMKPTDIADLLDKLETSGINTAGIDLSLDITVEDLINELSLSNEL